MEEEDAGPYGVLAEILVSKLVGLDHIRLVGELIVSQATMNASPGPVSADQIERVVVSEDKYKEAWQALKRNDNPALDASRLEELGKKLRETIRTFEQVCEELRRPTGD